MADVEELVEELRVPAGEPAGAIVLLHGRGTSEQDVAPLIGVFDPRERLVGAFPRGPLELPPIGHHWYATNDDGQATPRPSSPPSIACVRGSSGWPTAPGCRSSAPCSAASPRAR